MTEKPLVSLKNVSAAYDGGADVLSNVSLDVYRDDFLGVIGPNGGGKTTLVKVILGTLAPRSGTVEYAPELVSEGGGIGGGALKFGGGARKIGYLPQQSPFDRSFPITVGEVVLSGLQARRGFFGHYTRADRDKARKLLEMTGIAELERRPIGEISGGQMQRALLSRALVSEPLLLILDEPATYVDSGFTRELYDILRDLSRRMAIVMVSHDIDSTGNVAKNLVCVNHSAHVHRGENSY